MIQSASEQTLRKAKTLLEKGELAAIPTETVYGLAANALNENAVIKIFKVKNRPFFDPLIVHIRNKSEVKKYASEFPKKAKRLAEKFWPGPLSIVLPKSKIIPDIVTAGLDSVALRMPNHPVTLRLLKMLSFPLAAPSANPFGYVSPTSAQHVEKQLGKKIPLILDGGKCPVGVESTVISFTEKIPVILRHGGISVEEIKKVIGKVSMETNGKNISSPGMLKSHYATRKPLYIGKKAHPLSPSQREGERCTNVLPLGEDLGGAKLGILSFYKKYHHPNLVHSEILSPKKNIDEAARNLFSAMRRLDESEAEIILAEVFPDKGLGRAINDRLKRASAD